MIRYDVFALEITKLQEQFGDRHFSRRKSELIYAVVNKLQLSELSSIVDNFIGNAKFAPMLEDFQAAAARYKANRPQDAVKTCQTCSSMGIVVVRKKTGEVGDFGFRCPCELGNDFQYIPKWHDSMQKTFTKHIIPIELINKFYGLTKQEG